MPFTTLRLTLRARTDDDTDDLHALWDNTQVQPMCRSRPFAPLGPPVRKDITEWMDGCVFAAVVTLTDPNAAVASSDAEQPQAKAKALMGMVTLSAFDPKNRDASISIALLPQYWGGGYAREAMTFVVDHAFRWFGLHRVSLVVYGSNERAMGLYERLGFVVEGRKREALWMDNKWEDSISMGVLRREWAAKHWGDQS